MRRVLALVLAACLVGFLVWSGGLARGLVSVVYGWLLVGYLLWRAWPAVRSDLASLAALVRVRSGRRRLRGGYL